MSKFVYYDGFTVDFGEGKVFTVPDTDEFISETIDAVHEKVAKKIKAYANNDKEALNSVLDGIDELLGEGATGKIFEGHALTPRNIIGAYTFIYNEILDQFNEFKCGLEAMTAKQNKREIEEKQELAAAVTANLAQIGIAPPSPMPSAAEMALRPRL